MKAVLFVCVLAALAALSAATPRAARAAPDRAGTGATEVAVASIDPSWAPDGTLAAVTIVLADGTSVRANATSAPDASSTDVSVVCAGVRGTSAGVGRVSVVSKAPLHIAASVSTDTCALVVGYAAGKHTAYVGAHAAARAHTRSRYHDGADRAAYADGFTYVHEREQLRYALAPRNAFPSTYCASPEVTHELGVAVFLDRGMVRALEHALGAKAADRTAASGLTPLAEAWVGALVSQASVPFEANFTTRLVLKRVATLEAAHALSAHSAAAWNEAPGRHGCTASIDTMLTSFSAWQTAWHEPRADIAASVLLTDCFPPPGTIGLANTGYVCETESAFCTSASRGRYGNCVKGACPAASAACFSNTAVVSYVPGQAHVVFGHELAHVCGCVHSSSHGDIMSTYLAPSVHAFFNPDDTRRACSMLEHTHAAHHGACIRAVDSDDHDAL